MLLNRTNAEKLFVGFSALFQGAYEGVPQYWKMFSTLAPSSTTQELYHWVAQLPGMREWVGSRVKNSPVLRDYTVTNKHYEDTIALDKNRVKDDTHGAFGVTVQAFAQAVARWPDEVMASVVEAGTTATCFDGQNFFDTDHPVSLDDASLGTFSNKLVGAAYDITKDPIGVWQAISETMAAYKGDAGKPLAIVADTLMVPPNLVRWAKQAAKAELVPQTIMNVAGDQNVAAAAVTNVYKGDFTIIENPYLSATAVIGMCTTRAIKPFVWQLREAPVFTNLVDPTLPNCFFEKEFIYGAEGRGAGAYALPHLAIRCSAA